MAPSLGKFEHEEEEDNDRPSRYISIAHLYSSTSPCTNPNGSSNVMSKKVKARKPVIVYRRRRRKASLCTCCSPDSNESSGLVDSTVPAKSGKKPRLRGIMRRRTKRWVVLNFEGFDPLDVVGLVCKVFWPMDACWYAGSVIRYNSETKKHSVEYDDGDVEDLILSDEKIKFHISRDEMQCLNLKCSVMSTGKKVLNDEIVALAVGCNGCQEVEAGDIVWPKLTDSLYKRRKRGRNSRTITKEQKKLGTNMFESYLEDLWSKIPDEKKSSCTYLDCLWFYLYDEKGSEKSKVLMWIKKKQIFSNKYVFVPILSWGHWSLLILCHFGESIHSDTKKPCMLLLDSLQDINSQRLEPYIRSFVLDVYKMEGRGEKEDAISYIPLLVPKVPQQRDGEACGFFVLYFIQQFLNNAPEIFTQEDYPYFLTEDWFDLEDLESFRKEMESCFMRSLMFVYREEANGAADALANYVITQSGDLISDDHTCLPRTVKTEDC